MQTGSLALIEELELAIACGTSESRVATLHRVTDLFLASPGNSPSEQAELFDEVIGRLAADIETKARAELAERLAPADKAPRNVLKRLASDDDISVAGPVLTHSVHLDEEFLLESASKRSQEHLLAISKRVELSPVLTDTLVTRGDQNVVRTVARNDGARFSETGFETLVKKSESDEMLAVSVASRGDLPQEHFDKIIAKASQAVLEKLSAANPQMGTQIRDVIAKITSLVQPPAPARNYVNALAMVNSLNAVGKLGQDELAVFANAGKTEETIAAISVLCKLPIEAAEKVLLGDQSDPIVILGRAFAFSWITVRELIALRHNQLQPEPESIDSLEQSFKRLNPATAQRIMRFYKVRLAVVKDGS